MTGFSERWDKNENNTNDHFKKRIRAMHITTYLFGGLIAIFILYGIIVSPPWDGDSKDLTSEFNNLPCPELKEWISQNQNAGGLKEVLSKIAVEQFFRECV